MLANRLTEGRTRPCCCSKPVEVTTHPYIHVPIGVGKIRQEGLFNWGYETEPEPHLNGRRVPSFRGKVVGGSSSVNMMAYTRGHRADYDRWARNGATGWAYADLLPYFRKGESWEDGEDPWRGGSGPLGTEFAKTTDPLFDAWVEAAKAAGYPVTDDYNGKQQEGFGRGQYTIRNGYRSSSANAYLRPARKRVNLDVATDALATRVLLDGTRAKGVEYVRGGETVRVEAAREVILAAGTFNTPQLLMLSGIGPASHLHDNGITVIADLPVGKNLQDHLGAYMHYSRRGPGSFHREMRFDRMAVSMIRAYLFGSGPGTVVPGGLHAFVKTRPELAVPDIEFMFRGTAAHPHLWFPLIKAPFADGFGIRPTLLHSGQPRRVAARLGRPGEAAAHRLPLLHRAQRPAHAARGLQARPRARFPEGARSIPRR